MENRVIISFASRAVFTLLLIHTILALQLINTHFLPPF